MEINEKIEHIWFLYGIWFGRRFFGIRKYVGKGKEASVDFDWKKGLNPFVLGWMHTHPDNYGCNSSSTDDKTMRSWVRGLGRSLICVIKCGQEIEWHFYYRGPDKGIWTTYLKGYFKGIFIYGRH